LDENGTEAAAVTAIMMRALASNPEAHNVTKIFHAEYPFMFLIWDEKAETILFTGKITNP